MSGMKKAGRLTRELGGNMAASIAGFPGQPAAGPAAGGRMYEGRERDAAACLIDHDRIVPDPDQPRKTFDPAELADLAGSLEKHGQLQPIVVRWDAGRDRYVIVAGERRWRAANVAKLPQLRCVVWPAGERWSPADVRVLQLIENAVRADVRPVEQAAAYREVMAAKKWTAKDLAAMVNVNPGTITKSLALLALDEPTRAAVDAGDLAPAVGYELSKVADPALRKALAAEAHEKKLSRDQVAERARAAKPADAPSKGGRKAKGPQCPFVKPGDVVRTSYGTGPYTVVSASPDGRASWSLTLTDAGETKTRGTSYLHGFERQPDGRIVNGRGDELVLVAGPPGLPFWEWLARHGLRGQQQRPELQRAWMLGQGPPAEPAAVALADVPNFPGRVAEALAAKKITTLDELTVSYIAHMQPGWPTNPTPHDRLRRVLEACKVRVPLASLLLQAGDALVDHLNPAPPPPASVSIEVDGWTVTVTTPPGTAPELLRNGVVAGVLAKAAKQAREGPPVRRRSA